MVLFIMYDWNNLFFFFLMISNISPELKETFFLIMILN